MNKQIMVTIGHPAQKIPVLPFCIINVQEGEERKRAKELRLDVVENINAYGFPYGIKFNPSDFYWAVFAVSEDNEKPVIASDNYYWRMYKDDSPVVQKKYCPECGDDNYQNGTFCEVCEFPHKDLEETWEEIYDDYKSSPEDLSPIVVKDNLDFLMEEFEPATIQVSIDEFTQENFQQRNDNPVG